MATTAQQQQRKKGTKPVYYKSLAASEIKVSAESRTISGYAAVWGNVDDAGDMLIKGCCARSIDARGPASNTNRKIIFLFMHNMSDPVGRITKLVEDEKGLYFEAEIDRIPQGDRVLEQLKSGTLNQFSIGYMYVWDKCEYDNEKDCFIVKEINLFEISVVSLGCNEETGFEGLKGAQLDSERNQLVRDTEKALKSLPYETQFEIRQLISKHIALNDVDPGAAPLDKNDPPQKKAIDFKQLLTALKN